MSNELESIMSRTVVTDSGCAVWVGARQSSGYAEMRRRGQTILVHRRVASLVEGRELARDEVVLHACDNPPCINPDHLSVGSQADNVRDAARKGRLRNSNRSKTHCAKGHEFSSGNTRITPTGKRACRTCQRDAQRAYRARLAGGKLEEAQP